MKSIPTQGETAANPLLLVIFALFCALQVADGVFTYLGVLRLGIHVEGNPLVRWLMSTVGFVGGLTLVKLIAIGAGFGLVLLDSFWTLTGLSVFYLVVVALWAAVLVVG